MIELKDICKSFGDHVVLKNFSLKINKPRLFTAIPCEVAEIHVITVF